ncbi:hypothetical protein E4U57_005050 [Claviceps arundinis]|uniref:Uncharacterized protein n=1 Tax=Claviceps arundinis TaxID=1623583 RepID=A0ABQ7PI96_9HYPO|nr:hypothetical protein E4U57_005050 [Claviceps arundinis]
MAPNYYHLPLPLTQPVHPKFAPSDLNPQGVDAAMAIITLRRDSDDHPQQHSHITTPPQSPERAKRTSDWVEKHSIPELPGTSEEVESGKNESEKNGSKKD